MMTDKEIEIIDRIIDDLKPEICLEWGSGGSTVYFPQKHSCIKRWYSIETSGKWFNRIYALINKSKVRLVMRNIDSYLKVKGDFDLILVDGHMRNECLMEAKRIIKPNGIILLHDSERIIYKGGVELFGKKSKVLIEGQMSGNGAVNGLTKLWI